MYASYLSTFVLHVANDMYISLFLPISGGGGDTVRQEGCQTRDHETACHATAGYF